MSEDKPFGANAPDISTLAPDALPKSALACVQSARHAPSEYEARYTKAQAIPADPHVRTAREFLSKIDESLERKPIVELEEANNFAKRARADFPILNNRENTGLVYFDAAATSLQPYSVINSAHEFATHYASNIWRGNYPNAAYATSQYQKARERVAAHINADPRDVIFTTNTTASLNMVAHSWATHNINAGDTILIMCNEHHSNMIVWQRVAQRTGADVKFIPITLTGEVDMDAYKNMLGDKNSHVSLVCAAHVSNVIGIENPISEMAHLAHKSGAKFVLDAAQSAPHMPISVRTLGVDFIAMSGHKMHAPTGIGILWAHPDRVREMVPEVIGGGTISEVSFEGTYFRQAPYAFEPGTPPIEQAIALGAAVDYLDCLGMKEIEAHICSMTKYALRVASFIPGIQIIGSHSHRSGQKGLLSYTFDTQESSQLSQILGKAGVAVRSGAHCATHLALSLGIPGSVRISFGPYTTKEDVEAWGYAMHVISNITHDALPRS